MLGRYEMETTSGEKFDVAVPAFSLDCPDEAVQIH
jgi:ApaG protein